MAAFISFQPSDYFSTTTWSGDNTTPRTITGVGFQPDFSWLKDVSAAHNHTVWDVVRAAGSDNELTPNETLAEGGGSTAAYGYLSAFAADGFTVITGSSNNSRVNETGDDYISWNFKAGTTTGIDTTGTTITPSSYSFDQDRGQSIVTYAGNTVAGATLAHGLGAVPEMIVVKSINATQNWLTYHKNMDPTAPEDYYMSLNVVASRAASAAGWNDTAPTAVNIVLGSDNAVNGSYNYMAYSFVGKSGYSKFGGYEGNGNANGPFVYTGFRPNWLMVKSIDSGDSWHIANVKSSPFNVSNKYILANSNAAQVTSTTTDLIDILSNGFKPRASNAQVNGTNGYIYAAFAEFPFVSSNDVPGVAR